MLGRDVCDAAAGAGHEVLALARADLDITDADAVRAAVRTGQPDAIVNCAAWTDVDGAEAHEAAATAVNGRGAGNVASCGAYTVHVSSDYVFDGTASEPYPEHAPPRPASAYGRSKLAGERAVAAASAGPGHAIVRSSWLFGPHGRNFVATMLRLAAERDEVTVVDDQVGSPTFTGHLAPALVAVAERRLPGILHVAGSGAASWWELAREAFAQAGVACEVRRGSTAALGRPAPRPAFSVLGRTRVNAPVLPDWRDGVAAYLRAWAEVEVLAP